MEEKKNNPPRERLGKRAEALFADHTAKITPQSALMGWLTVPIAFLLAICRLPFSVYPLGLALLCASTEKTLAVAIGLAASCIVLPFPPILTLCVIAGTLAVRILARVFIDLPIRIGGDGRRGEIREHLHGRLFCEALYLRMACVCVSVFTMNLYAIIAGGFRYYDLFGALFSLSVSPLAVFLFSGLFKKEDPHPSEKKSLSLLPHLSHVTLSAAVCYSLSSLSPLGAPTAAGAAFLATLLICRKDGFFTSLSAAVLCGLSIDLPLIPILAVAAVTAFFLREVSAPLAAILACVAASVCSLVLLGTASVENIILPLPLGTAAYCSADKLLRPHFGANTPRRPCPIYLSERQLRSQSEATLRISETLLELSAVAGALNKRQKKPSSADLRLLCDACFDRVCPDCTYRTDCWELRYHTMLDMIDRLIEQLHGSDRLTRGDLPDSFRQLCPHTERLVETINHQSAVLSQSIFCSQATEIFSLSYGVSSTLMKEICTDQAAIFRKDEKNTAAILSRLKALGYTASDVHMIGDRAKLLLIRGLYPPPDASQTVYLENQLARLCGFPLSPLTTDQDGTLCAHRTAAIDVVFAGNCSAHEGVCGDVLSMFRDDTNGYFFAILNDGMGAGKEAAFTAQLASLFLRKLLPSGVRAETALRMLNHFLRLARNQGSAESSTTVDLLMLDLIQRRAVFLKSGAAPTYVKRGSNIFYLDSGTAPLGILPEMDAKQIDFEVRDGDLVVMVSDGVNGGDGECLWLLDYLDSTDIDDPEALAKHIVADATERGNADDLSAIVLRIKQK